MPYPIGDFGLGIQVSKIGNHGVPAGQMFLGYRPNGWVEQPVHFMAEGGQGTRKAYDKEKYAQSDANPAVDIEKNFFGLHTLKSIGNRGHDIPRLSWKCP